MFQAESVSDAAFGCDWVGTAIPFQRCLLFIIATANKALQLTAGKFVPVSNVTMMNVGKINTPYFFHGSSAPIGPGLPPCSQFSVTLSTTQSVGLHCTGDQPTPRTLPDNTQHSQETDFHDSGGIRTRHRSKRTAANPGIKPRGNRDVLEYNATNIL